MTPLPHENKEGMKLSQKGREMSEDHSRIYTPEQLIREECWGLGEGRERC